MASSTTPRRKRSSPSASRHGSLTESDITGSLHVDTSNDPSSNIAGLASPPALPYPVTFIIAPAQAYDARETLSRLGLCAPPPPLRSRSNSSTIPPTPTASYPGTPSAGLPRGTSPFIPMTAMTAANGNGKDLSKSNDPKLQIALANAFHDDVLPLSVRTSLRSFSTGYAIQTVLIAILPRLMKRKTNKEALRALLSIAATRLGLSFALFTLLYRFCNYMLTLVRLKALAAAPRLTPSSLTDAPLRMRLLMRLIRICKGNGVVPFFSVLAASPALHLLPASPTFPRKTISIDLFIKALYHHFHVLKKRNSSLVSWIPEFCDTALLYAIGNGQLLWANLFEPDCFPQSYGDFVLARSSAYIPDRSRDMPRSVQWPSKREIFQHIAVMSTPNPGAPPFPGFISPALSALHPTTHPTTPYEKINPVLDWAPAHPAHTKLLCAMMHPTEPSCRRNYLKYWAAEWQQSAKFVAAFMAVFNVLKLSKWKRDPEGQIFRFVMSVVQGATLISGTIATAWSFTCFFQHYLPRTFLPRARFFLNGFLSSVFIFAVPAARRAQLGLYVARLSADSTWQVLVKRRKAKNIQNGDVLLLTLGLAMLASLYEDTPHVLTGYLRRVVRLVCGPRLAGTASSVAGLPLDAPTRESPGHQRYPSAVDANALDSRLLSSK